jgi:hypothetical protein
MNNDDDYDPKVDAESILKRHKEYRETVKRERISTQQKFLDASNEYLGDKRLEKEGNE